MNERTHHARLASPDDAEVLASLLHDFNTEFDTPTPDVGVLALRLRALLAGDSTFAVLAGEPAVGFALVTLRPNVWYAGKVALLDEMYVAPHLRDQGIGSVVMELLLATARARGVALMEINVDEGDVDTQRFYARHAFSGVDDTTGQRAFYFAQELG